MARRPMVSESIEPLTHHWARRGAARFDPHRSSRLPLLVRWTAWQKC